MLSKIAATLSLASAAVATGISITNEDQILVLMNGLPPSYDSFAVSLNVTTPSELTLNYTVICLINKYKCLCVGSCSLRPSRWRRSSLFTLCARARGITVESEVVIAVIVVVAIKDSYITASTILL